MNETNLREYAVSYKRKKYIKNTKLTRIQKIRARMYTNTTTPKINKEAHRIRIGCTVYHADFRAKIAQKYTVYTVSMCPWCSQTPGDVTRVHLWYITGSRASVRTLVIHRLFRFVV
jgi:glutaredoxin